MCHCVRGIVLANPLSAFEIIFSLVVDSITPLWHTHTQVMLTLQRSEILIKLIYFLRYAGLVCLDMIGQWFVSSGLWAAWFALHRPMNSNNLAIGRPLPPSPPPSNSFNNTPGTGAAPLSLTHIRCFIVCLVALYSTGPTFRQLSSTFFSLEFYKPKTLWKHNSVRFRLFRYRIYSAKKTLPLHPPSRPQTR